MFIHLHSIPPRVAAALALLLVFGGKGLAGETSPPGDPLSLASALSIALTNSPVLKAYGYEARVAEAQILQAGIRPNPEISLGVENFLGTGAMSGVKGLETTLQLSQVIDLGGSISQRVATAQSARTLANADYEINRLDVLAEVGRRYIEAAADDAKLISARQAREVGESAVSAVQKRVDAALSSPIDLYKARTALGLLQIREEHAEHELIAHRRHLAAALGQSIDDFGPIRANLLHLPEVPEFESLAIRLENSPVLARYSAEARWRTAQIGLAQSLRRAGATFSGGLKRNEASDSFGLVAGISIPLAVREANVGNIREARERRDQTKAASEARRLELQATLFEVYQEMIHARTVVTILTQDLIPAAQQTLDLANAGYSQGRFSILDLLDAQKSLLELKQMLITSATTFHLHLIEIERLLGAPV
jgi:cobalt-zinc-cadmium efflux system outer membrane protein